jgi:hypothetical protein
VQVVLLARLDGVEAVHDLLVVRGAERRGHEGLRLAAGEERRAVRAGEDAHLDGDRADVRGLAAVHALVGERGLADQDPLDLVRRGADVGRRELARDGHLVLGVHERGLDRLADGLDGRLAGELGRLVQGLAQRRLEARGHRGDRRRVDGLLDERHGLPAGLLAQLADRVADAPDHGVAEEDRLEHDLLGQLVGAGLDHRHGGLRAGHHEVERAVLHRLDVGEGDELVALHADADRAQGAEERHRRQRERGARRDDREHVRVVRLVVRDGERLDLDVVLEPLGPERPDGPVRHAHREDLTLARRALALHEAARDLAGRVRLLAIVDRQREEVGPLARRAGAGAGEDDRVAEPHRRGARREQRQPPGLDDE